MRFLIDAQLPRRLAVRLNALGHDALHTLELPNGNLTTDQELMHTADDQDRILVSKDRDFVDACLIRGTPRLLLWITTGNISNNDLLTLIEDSLQDIEDGFVQAVHYVELNQSAVTIH